MSNENTEAADEKEAIAKARKFLAPKCRNDWDPLSVDEMED